MIINTKQSKRIIHYYSPTKISIKRIKQLYNRLPGSIDVVYDTLENVVTVININILPEHRGKGYAMFLLLYVCSTAFNMNIRYIELDDCTSRYRKDSNIYKKLGLSYIEDDGPEMNGDINNILKKGRYVSFPSEFNLYDAYLK